MPIYSSDNRVPGTGYHTTATYAGEVYWVRKLSYAKTSGQVKYFSGPSEGKFTPGIVRINNMTATRTSYVYQDVDWATKHTSPKSIVKISGPCTSVQSFSLLSQVPTWDNALTGYATQRAYSRLLESELDVGEFLAELPQTISMVRGGVNLLLSAIQKAKQSGFTWNRVNRARLMLLAGKSIKRLPRSLANAWLTWRYGIRPLIWDVQGFIKAANEVGKRSDFSGLRRVRGRAERNNSINPVSGFNAVVDQYSGYYAWTEMADLSEKAEAVIYYKYGVGFSDVDYILLKYGLHPTQFPYLLWQLVPLSFMLDWFVDVGTWVKAITPTWQFEVLGCSCSQKTTLRITRTIRLEPVSPDAIVLSGSLSQDSCVRESIDRRRQTLQGEIPRLKPKIALSIQQQCDLLSVLLQRALSKGRH